MKSKIVQQMARLVLIATVALGLVGAQVVAYAQTTACFGLKADDCQLLAAARTSSLKSLTSFNLDYDIKLNVTGAPEGDTKFSLQGTGPVDLNGVDLSTATSTDPSAAPAMTKLTGALGKLILGTTAVLDATTKGKTVNYRVELRVLDNKLYVNEANLTKGKWQFLDLRMMAGMMAGMTGNLPSAIATKPAASPQSADMMKQMQALTQIEGVLTAERGPDVKVGNDQLAAFILHVDLQKLLAAPELPSMIKAAQANSTSDKQMTDAEIAASIEKAKTATKDLKISFTRFVGVSDKLTHGGSVDITGSADLSSLKDAAPTGGALGSSVESAVPSGPVNLDIHLKVVVSGIGQKVNVAAPADALPFKFGAPPTSN